MPKAPARGRSSSRPPTAAPASTPPSEAASQSHAKKASSSGRVSKSIVTVEAVLLTLAMIMAGHFLPDAWDNVISISFVVGIAYAAAIDGNNLTEFNFLMLVGLILLGMWSAYNSDHDPCSTGGMMEDQWDHNATKKVLKHDLDCTVHGPYVHDCKDINGMHWLFCRFVQGLSWSHCNIMKVLAKAEESFL